MARLYWPDGTPAFIYPKGKAGHCPLGDNWIIEIDEPPANNNGNGDIGNGISELPNEIYAMLQEFTPSTPAISEYITHAEIAKNIDDKGPKKYWIDPAKVHPDIAEIISQKQIMKEGFRMEIIPNPIENRNLRLRIQSSISEIFEIRIYERNSILVRDETHFVEKGYNIIEMEVPGSYVGNYHVTVTCSFQSVSKHFWVK